MFEVDISGFDQVVASIKQHDQQAQEAVKQEVKRSGEAIVNAAKARVPVGHGSLKTSIKLQLTNQGMTVTIAAGDTPDGYIGKFVEYGTGIFSVSKTAPKKPWTIKPKKDGGVLVLPGGLRLREVTVKGQKPQPFLHPAWEAERPRFIDRLTKALKGAMK